jgi:hypothetical protein
VGVIGKAGGESNLRKRHTGLCQHCTGSVDTPSSKIFSDAYAVVAAKVTDKVSPMDTTDSRKFSQCRRIGETLIEPLAHSPQPRRRLTSLSWFALPDQVCRHF